MVMVMAGSMSEDYVTVGGSSPANGFSNLQHCQSVESLAEWRSCDQVENGTPSTSPPYWDSDEEDDHGPKPSDLYGKFTWKIENFSQISKRELRSNMFEVGDYRWYILIYPQGCDACNHLSLFLCVADHDKLLPGWGHYALFTIAVVNRDPKKNKYNDTLHKFCKKEHDWGWKKFLEQTKVMDGFVDDDTLTIKAQVQVIREKAHRPFRCLDCQYRRELIRVYLSNVEQTCGRFVDEKRQKLQTLVGDKTMWSSFHAFWLGIDQDARCHLSRDKIDDILKKVVKHFFIEKEVSSTLVMDSLYSGLRALENMIKMKKLQLKNHEESAPFILIEDGMFVLADDVFLLLERAALELPRLSWPSKEENGLPNRAKDGSSGDEFNRGSVLCEERRLTELGCKTLEIFILADIFSNRIERAYREAVALKIQEELIREEEAAEQAENEKREKRAKKKQAKQRRNNRKSKDGGNDEKSEGMMAENIQLKECAPDEQVLRGDASDVSDPGNDGNEARQPDVEYKDASQIHRSTEACSSEIPNGHSEKRSSYFVDDSCSTESVLSAAKGPYNWNILPNSKNKRNSSRRGKKQQNQEMRNGCPSNAAQLLNVSSSSISTGPEPKGLIYAFKDQIKKLEQTFFKKSSKEELYMTTSGETFLKDKIDEEIPCISMPTESSSSSTSPTRKSLIKTDKDEVSTPELTSRVTIKTEKIEEVSTPDLTSQVLIKTEKIEEVSRPELAPKILIKTEKIEEVSTPRLTLTTLIKTKKSANPSVKLPQNLSISKSEAPKHQASSTSRPCIPITKPTVSLASSSQASPLLSGTLSSINCLKSKPSLLSQNLEQQSYRNVIMGVKTRADARTTGPNLQPSSSSLTQSYPIFQPSSSSSVNPGISFGSVRPESLHNIRIGSNYESVASSSHSQGAMPDEFPHLDIINDLLEEDGIVGMATFNGYHLDDLYPLNWQRNFPTDVDPLHGPCQLDLPEYYYDEMSQVVYESFLPFSGFSELQHAQSDFSVYGNGADAFIQNQWPIDRVDLSMMNFGSTMDVNGYAYQVLEHATCGVGGYNVMHHPADGI